MEFHVCLAPIRFSLSILHRLLLLQLLNTLHTAARSNSNYIVVAEVSYATLLNNVTVQYNNINSTSYTRLQHEIQCVVIQYIP